MMLAGLTLVAAALAGATVPAVPGQTYEVVLVHRDEYSTNDGGSGNSGGTDSIAERIISRSSDGIEIEYDLPHDATEEDRAKTWQFPARVFKPLEGAPRLLNAPELEDRVDAWLKAAELPREACGRWIFTWSAFRIDCDPQSVLEAVEVFDMRADGLGEGSPYSVDYALAPAPMQLIRSGPEGSLYEATLQVDPEAVRRAAVESDLVVAEITGEALSQEQAWHARAGEQISGTITVTIETDAQGQAWRRTTKKEIRVERPNGEVETRTGTETLERRLSDAKVPANPV